MPRRPDPDDPGQGTPEPRPRCPVCRTPVAPGGKAFPFCCPRCKLIDLGRWLGGDYRIELPADATDREIPPGAPPDPPPGFEDTSS